VKADSTAAASGPSLVARLAAWTVATTAASTVVSKVDLKDAGMAASWAVMKDEKTVHASALMKDA